MKKNIFGLLLKLVGLIILVIDLILVVFIFSETESTIIFGISSYILLGATLPLFLLFFGLGTIICLLADIEWNTRKQNRKNNEEIKLKKSNNENEIEKEKSEGESKKQKMYENITIAVVIIGGAAIVLTILFTYVF